MKEYEKTFEEKLIEEKKKIVKKEEEKDLSVPHLFNLNEDPLLSGKVYHNLSSINVFYIGREKV